MHSITHSSSQSHQIFIQELSSFNSEGDISTNITTKRKEIENSKNHKISRQKVGDSPISKHILDKILPPLTVENSNDLVIEKDQRSELVNPSQTNEKAVVNETERIYIYNWISQLRQKTQTSIVHKDQWNSLAEDFQRTFNRHLQPSSVRSIFFRFQNKLMEKTRNSSIPLSLLTKILPLNTLWSSDQDNQLIKAVKENNEILEMDIESRWNQIAQSIQVPSNYESKTPLECRSRWNSLTVINSSLVSLSYFTRPLTINFKNEQLFICKKIKQLKTDISKISESEWNQIINDVKINFDVNHTVSSLEKTFKFPIFGEKSKITESEKEYIYERIYQIKEENSFISNMEWENLTWDICKKFKVTRTLENVKKIYNRYKKKMSENSSWDKTLYVAPKNLFPNISTLDLDSISLPKQPELDFLKI